MILPKIDSDGRYYISYSQITSWNELKGYNTKMLGKYEYMLKYFFGEKYGDDAGFAQFGIDVEDYILNRSNPSKFSKDELETLDKIKPLDNGQVEFKLEYPEHNFYVLGYIDDATNDLSHIRDYKTASLNSSKKYYTDEYKQLDVYALAIRNIHGFIPQKLEVVCIERLGNGFKGGRDVMTVGKEIWYINKETNNEKLDKLYDDILKTAKEISSYWEVFCKLNKIIK